MKKLFYKTIAACLFSLSSILAFGTAGTITPSITTSGDPVFIQGASGFENIFTISGAPAGTESVYVCVVDNQGEVLDSTLTIEDGADWVDTLDMGELDSTAVVLVAHYYDANGDFIDESDPYNFSMIDEPAGISNGNLEITADSIDDAGIAYLQFVISMPDSSAEIDDEILGIGGKEFGFSDCSIVLFREFNVEDGSLSGDHAVFEYTLSAFGEEITTNEFDLDNISGLNVSIDAELNPVITGHFSYSKEFFTFNMRDKTLPLPMIKPASVSVGAGLKVEGGVSVDCYVGLDNSGNFGFIEGSNGELSNACIGAKITGDVRITGSLVNKHIAGIQASLDAIGRIGAAYNFKTAPDFESSLDFGGDILIKGKVALTGAVGWFKRKLCGASGWCEANNEILDGVIWPRDNGDQPKSFGNFPTGLDSLFRSGMAAWYNNYSRSLEMDTNAFFDIPDASPQPAFASKAGHTGVAWIEADTLQAQLLFSMLDTAQNRFTTPVPVTSNSIYLAEPKAAFAPDGSAIITWTQCNLDINLVDSTYDLDSVFNNLEVWYAVYNTTSNTITAKSRIYDTEGLAMSQSAIAISDSGKVLISWLSEDTTGNTDIWYTTLTNGNGIWYQSTPDMINDLPGNNYEVQLGFIDSTKAIAAWLSDADGEDSTVGNDIIISYYDGEVWSSSESLSNGNSDEEFNDLAMIFNKGYGLLAYTSTIYPDDEDGEINTIKAIPFQNGAFNTTNAYEFSDSLSYTQMPKITINDNGIAVLSYQVVDVYEEEDESDAGSIELVIVDLSNGGNNWQLADFSEDIAQDTSVYPWDMEMVLTNDNILYSLSQEQDTVADELGQPYQPVTGVLFGKPDMGLVLRGLQINSNLSISPAPTSSLPEVPTGISNITPKAQNALSVFVYPNPAKESLTVEYFNPSNEKVTIELLNLLGQPIIITQPETNIGLNRLRLNTSNLVTGVYILRVSTALQSRTVRVIIE